MVAQKLNLNLNQCSPNQHSPSRTVYMCVHTIVHNCRTEYSTEQFW